MDEAACRETSARYFNMGFVMVAFAGIRQQTGVLY
jgi:hypothetical protein